MSLVFIALKLSNCKIGHHALSINNSLILTYISHSIMLLSKGLETWTIPLALRVADTNAITFSLEGS